MRKKSNNIGEWFLLRSVGDESVDILFIVRDNSKSLPDELVCDSDHSEFSRFSVLPEPRIGLFALGIEPTGRPSGDIEKSSSVCVSVSVDMPFDVYRSSGLFVSGTNSEIPGHLLGILEVGKASSSDDERRGKRYAYPLMVVSSASCRLNSTSTRSVSSAWSLSRFFSRNLIVSSTV